MILLLISVLSKNFFFFFTKYNKLHIEPALQQQENQFLVLFGPENELRIEVIHFNERGECHY